MLLEINPDNPQPRLISRVVDMLRSGAVICYPTDTGYGFGCDLYSQKAIKRIFQLKRRDKDKPFSFLCSNLKNVSDYAYVSNNAYRLMRKNLPGPYTFILPGSKLVPKIMITRQKTVGIRVPENAICMALIEELGNPILNTSAVVDPDEPPRAAGFEFEERFGKLVDLVIDGGRIYPDPSTIISLVSDEPELLRPGKGDPTPFFG